MDVPNLRGFGALLQDDAIFRDYFNLFLNLPVSTGDSIKNNTRHSCHFLIHKITPPQGVFQALCVRCGKEVLSSGHSSAIVLSCKPHLGGRLFLTCIYEILKSMQSRVNQKSFYLG